MLKVQSVNKISFSRIVVLILQNRAILKIAMKHLYKNLVVALLSTLFSINSSAQCWRTISSKFDQVAAISYDSTLWVWGGAFGRMRSQTYPVQMDTNQSWKEVSTGIGYFMALKSDGTLWGYGENGFGQLGDSTNRNKWTLTRVTNDSNWVHVSCGNQFTLAVKSNGTVWAWGRNNYGQLATGTNRTNRNYPVQIGTITNVTEISAGRDFSLIRKTDNTLWHVGACYNSSNVSQLRQVGSNDWKTMSGGSYTNYAIKQNGQLWKFVSTGGRPVSLVRVGSASDWKKVDNSHTYSSESHALFLKNNGSIWGMGNNEFGELGTGNLTNAPTVPVQIGSATNWRDIVAGQYTSFGLKTDTSYWAWGRNVHAQFGNGKNKNNMELVSGSGTWRSVILAQTTRNSHALGIKSDGSLWGWGQNSDAQLGNGVRYSHKALPIKIGSDTTWKQATAGFHFSMAIKKNGTLWGWGRTSRGQLGLGSISTTRTTPTQVGTDTTWNYISAGNEFTLGIKKDSTLWAWGYNYDGQLGTGNSTQQKSPVKVAAAHKWIKVSTGNAFTAALKSDSTLWTWGDNDYGQLGRTGNRYNPTQVGTDKYIDIDCGGYHLLAIKSNGELYACGRNNQGQVGDGTTRDKGTLQRIGTASNWKTIDAGNEHSLGVKKDSTLWVWGINSNGQLVDSATMVFYPYKVVNPIQKVSTVKWGNVAGGAVNSLFLAADGKLYSSGDAYNAEYQTNYPTLGYVYDTPQLLNNCGKCFPSATSISNTICRGDSMLFDGKYLTSAGTYYDTLTNASGCDSVVTLTLGIQNRKLSLDVISACDSLTWIDGVTYTADNFTARDTLQTSIGCDSIVILNLTIFKSVTRKDTRTACDEFTWINGKKYTQSNNTDTVMYKTVNGCDSIIQLDLTLNKTVFASDSITACDSLTWINGITYYANNSSAVDTLRASTGCDSIVRLNLTVNKSVTATDTLTACDSLVWIDGKTYTADNNTATHTLKTALGCDSLITLNLNILKSTTAIDTHEVCDSFTWIDGNTYTSSNNTATHKLKNAAGCDSLVQLNLTINKSVAVVDTQKACGSYTWIDGNTYTTNNSTAKHTLKTVKGCDSVITLNLTLTQIDTTLSLNGIDLSSNQNGANYQWLDCNESFAVISGATNQNFTPTKNGTYAVELSLNGCMDTSECKAVTKVGVQELANTGVVKVYPNPTNGRFYVQLTSLQQEVSIRLVNVLGKVVYQNNYSEIQQTELNIEGASGVYYLLVHTENGVEQFRVVKGGN